MTIKLNLKRKETRFKNVEAGLLSTFHTSATGKSNKAFRFAKVDSNITAFLPYLKDGAVKLYLYYAAAANNDTGESWHSIDTISKKLGATERSVGNWNNQLEELGLIFRTSTGKKSKATFVLPLTGFAVKLNLQQIEQVLDELNLFEPSMYTRVFGQVQSLTKLYIKNEATDSFSEVLCVHLRKVTFKDSIELNTVDTYMYNTPALADADTAQKLSQFEGEEKVAVIDGEKKLILGKRAFESFKSYFINEASKIDDTTIFEIMGQLTDDVDLSDLPKISINNEGGSNG